MTVAISGSTGYSPCGKVQSIKSNQEQLREIQGDRYSPCGKAQEGTQAVPPRAHARSSPSSAVSGARLGALYPAAAAGCVAPRVP
jgi:hypothetical protein